MPVGPLFLSSCRVNGEGVLAVPRPFDELFTMRSRRTGGMQTRRERLQAW